MYWPLRAGYDRQCIIEFLEPQCRLQSAMMWELTGREVGIERARLKSGCHRPGAVFLLHHSVVHLRTRPKLPHSDAPRAAVVNNAK